MASEKSTLEIEVVTKGIGGNGGAVQWLDKLGTKAEQVEAKVSRLTTTVGRLITQHDRASTAAQAHMNALGAVGQAFGQMSMQLQQVAAHLQSMTSKFDQLTSAANQSSNALAEKSRRGGVVTTTLRAMAAAASAYLSLNFAVGIVKAGDAWSMMQAKLKLATGSMEEAKQVQGDLFNMAQKLRVPLEDVGKLYTRMSIPMQKMGKDSQEIAEQVEFVSLALKLGGATAAEASSVMLQYSQSVNAGRLNGAEFNAVAEAAPSILRAIEAELKATGQGYEETGKTLKQMGADGEITFELISRAAKRALPQFREDFKEIPITVDDALTRVKNAWFKAMGELGQDTELGKKLASAIAKLEESIPAIRDTMVNTFLFIQNNLQTIIGVFTALVGLKFVGWAVEVASGLATIATAAKNAGGAMVILGNAARFLTGPFGIATAAVGAAIAVYNTFAKDAPKAEAAVTTATQVQVVDRIKLIQKEIDKLNERNNLHKNAPTTEATEYGAGGALPADVQAKLNHLTQLRTKYLAETNETVKAGMKITIDQRQAEFDIAMNQLTVLTNLKNMNQQHDKAAKAAATTKEFWKEVATDTQKGMEKIAEWRKKVEEAGGAWTATMQKAAEVEFLPKTPKAKKSQAEKEAEKADKEENNKVKDVNEETEAIRKLVQAQQAENEAIGQTYAAKANLEALKDEARASDLILLANTLDAMDKTNDLSAAYRAQAEELKKLAALKREGGLKQDGLKDEKGDDKLTDSLDKFLDPSKALAFGDALVSAFGRSGTALKQLTESMKDYSKRQSAMAAAKEKAFDIKDDKKRADYLAKLNDREVKDRLSSYADMTGAAKGFFKEGTKGYAALETAEKTFRAFELALAMESFLEKSGLLTAFTTMFVASKTTETAAETASVAPHVAAEGAKQSANAITALTSALAAPFPANIAAFAMVAAMLAAIGVAVGGANGGGKSMDVAKERQSRQGTGTVLGDDAAKSESLVKSIELLSDNSNIALKHSSGMLAALVRIRDSISGMTKVVLQSSGLRGTVEDGKKYGVGSSSGFLGLTGKKKELVDSGIYIPDGQTLQSVINGVAAQGYVDIKTTKKSLFSSSSKTKTHYSDLQDSLVREIGLTMDGFADGISAAATALGRNGEAIRNQLQEYVVNIGQISLKGLSADEIQKELEAVFGSIADDMAQWAVGGFEEFQKAGEGYFQTLVRVAEGVERAGYLLDLLNVQAIKFGDIINKNGDVATEIVRQSLMAAQFGSNIATFLYEFQGSAEDLVEMYQKLVDVKTNLKLTGLGDDISRAMIKGAGGLDNLQSSMDDFIEGMFSETEQRAFKATKLQAEFAKLGKDMPKNTTEFRNLVQSLKGSGEAGEELMGKILALSGAFLDLQETLTTEVEDARSRLQDAYDREADRITTLKDKFDDFGKSLRAFQDSLLTDSLSPLTLGQKYAQSRSQYEETLAKARTGDQDAIAEFQNVAQKFLQFSQQYYASGSAYISDFNSVMTETEYLAQFSEQQVSMAEASLEALNKQVEGLLDINESVLTVAQAIEELKTLLELQGGGATTAVVNGSHADGLPYVPFDGYVAELHKGEAVLTASENKAYMAAGSNNSNEVLCAEIIALRQEVKQLREDQNRQTGDLIASNYDANERAARTVANSVDESISNSDRKVAVQPKLN